MPSIEAHITSVEQDANNGWYRIGTDHTQVRQLSTKIAEKAREAQALERSKDMALIEYTEKQGNVNKHTGKPYLDYYYEQAGSVQPELPDIPVTTPTRAKTDPDEAWRICLAAGGKLAVATLPLMPKEQQSFEAQKAVAFAWARFFFFSHAPEPGFDDLATAGESNEADGIPF